MPEPERRRDVRVNIAWPVVVDAGSRRFHLQTLNISRGGAKVGLTEPLDVGTPAQLHFHRRNQPAFEVAAVVWRADPDGVVFLFIGNNQLDISLA